MAGAPSFDNLIRCLQQNVPGLRAVYLFGSYASATADLASDVDLAFLAETSLSAQQRHDIAEECARIAGRPVDLVELLRADTVITVQVLSTGRLLYARDPADIGNFEATSLSRYQNLTEERRGIIEDILRRGAIHGG